MSAQKKTRDNITKVKSADNLLTTPDQETSEVMNNYFVSVFVADEDINILEFQIRNLISTMDDIEINPTFVEKSNQEIKPHQVTRPR